MKSVVITGSGRGLGFMTKPRHINFYRKIILIDIHLMGGIT